MSEQASQSLAIRGILAWRRTCLDYVWGEERQKDKQRLFWPIMTTNQCVACWRCDRIKAEVWYHWCVLEPTYPSQICMVIGGVLIWAKWAQFFCADIKICFSKTNKRKKKKQALSTELVLNLLLSPFLCFLIWHRWLTDPYLVIHNL